jgi:hypothetical protein
MWKQFYRTLSIRGNDFIAHWAYKERIFAYAQPAVKCEQCLHVNPCWAYAERYLSHTEHTENKFYCWLSILGSDFIAGWAYAEMFEGRISRPNRIRFSKKSHVTGPWDHKVSVSARKFLKKFHACVPVKGSTLVFNVCLNSHEIAILNSVGRPIFPHQATAA